jgi:hypothetical protein
MVERAFARTVVNQASPLPSLGPVGFHPPACALRLLMTALYFYISVAGLMTLS